LFPSNIECSFKYVIVGNVTDSVTEEPIVNIPVQIEDAKTTTDEHGKFILNTSLKKVQLVVAVPGYKIYRQLLKYPYKPIKIKLELMTEYIMDRIYVRDKIEKNEGSKQKLQVEQVNKTTTHIFSDSVKTLQLLPGVVTGNDFTSLMYIRGGDAYETIAFLDNVVVPNPYIWGGTLTIFNPAFIENINFYSGGFPAKFPEALSGVLDIKNIEGDYVNRKGFTEFSIATVEVFIQGPIEKNIASYIFGIRRTQYDLLLNLFSKNKNIVYPFFYDTQGKIVWKKDDKNKFYFNFVSSYEGMDFEVTSEDTGDERFTGYFNYRNFRIMPSFNWEKKINDTLSNGFTFAYTDTKSNYNFNGPDTELRQNSEQNEFFVKNKIEYISTNHVIEQGLGIYKIYIDLDSYIKYKTLMPDGTYLYNDISYKYAKLPVTISVFYIQDDIVIVKNLINANIGIIYSALDRTNDSTLCPRTGLSITVSENTVLKFNTGLYTRFPLSGSAIFDNTDVKAEKTIHYILGLEKKISNIYLVRLECYYKDYYDRIVTDPEKKYTNNGIRKAKGIDLFIQKKISEKWDGWVSYSYLDANDKILSRSDPLLYGKSPLDYPEPVNEWFPFENEREHNFSVVLNYNLKNKWKLATTFRYSTGTPYTPVSGALLINNVYVPQYGKYMSERIPDYQRLDIKLTIPGFNNNWEIYFQTINTLNHPNVDRYIYSPDYSTKKEITMLPFMIITGFKYSF